MDGHWSDSIKPTAKIVYPDGFSVTLPDIEVINVGKKQVRVTNIHSLSQLSCPYQTLGHLELTLQGVKHTFAAKFVALEYPDWSRLTTIFETIAYV